MSCSAAAVVPSRRLFGKASNQAAHSAWIAISSAAASFQRFARLRRLPAGGPALCRGLRPYHAQKDRAGTWETSCPTGQPMAAPARDGKARSRSRR
jgi:hypothetical protein